MHEDHEKADITSLLLHGLVVALPDVFGDGFVKKLLIPMSIFPPDRGKLRTPGFEKRLAVGIDSLAFLSADNVRLNPVTSDTAHIREGLGIDKGDQAVKSVRLSLMWCGGEH